MFGFAERLDWWLSQAAKSEFDAPGEALHPPAAYMPKSTPWHFVIPRVDTPSVKDSHWFGLARLNHLDDERAEIVGWSELEEPTTEPVAAALLLSQPMPFEFPQTVDGLFQELKARSVSTRLLLAVLKVAAIHRDKDQPLFLVVGTPMRGLVGQEMRQHLTVWKIAAPIALALDLALGTFSRDEGKRTLGQAAESVFLEWAQTASVEWCYVMEDRPEVTHRRDSGSPLHSLAGRNVAVLGCGALGSYVSLLLAQTGVGRLFLLDSGRVRPGLLVRQFYGQQDIGLMKASCLAKRLKGISPNVDIQSDITDVGAKCDADPSWAKDVDLIIDCTASRAAHIQLELWRRQLAAVPPLVSMIISGTATKGIVVTARKQFTGGPQDLFYRTRLAVCRDRNLSHFADEFYPEQHPELFQPEPGCSDPTFVGSSADCCGLAAMMLNVAAKELRGEESGASAVLLTASVGAQSGVRSEARFAWTGDISVEESIAGYEVRISSAAWKDIDATIASGIRRNGPSAETGGLLFGRRDDSLRMIWVTEATSPPPDSVEHADMFICGVIGNAEQYSDRSKTSRKGISFVGMWHTHPDSLPIPSATDTRAMARLMTEDRNAPIRSLLLIVGVGRQRSIGAYQFERSDIVQNRVRDAIATVVVLPNRRESHASRVGLALSGGGSRAIAFHLGCLRALHDRGVLDKVCVLSTVSGGSVIGALYASHRGSFAEFDQCVVELLRRGLQRKAARHLFLSPLGLKVLATTAIAGTAAVAARLGRRNPMLPRWFSRTNALRSALESLFPGLTMRDLREDLEVVINASELTTGTAFRFGTSTAGSWRIGNLSDPGSVPVSLAVAASAAYPALLPALDVSMAFSEGGVTKNKRAILSDGGVFDNLGITVMEPGRDSRFSPVTAVVDYIVACNAGQGTMSRYEPYFALSRTRRATEVIFKKVQDAAMDRLHRHQADGRLKGFVLPYLGLNDKELPHTVPGLVPREAVVDYPTNFAAMKESDIETLSLRGQQLTQALLSYYCSDL
jgi:integrative and conjugative element protein (TIGR02256 family)